MPLSKSIHMYHDIAQALTSARAAGGAVFRAETAGKATAWRQRAYYYRKLLAQADEAKHAAVPGYFGSTEWDDVTLTIDSADPTAVRIEFGVVRGQLEALDGSTISSAPVAAKKPRLTAEDEALLEIAKNFAVEIDRS